MIKYKLLSVVIPAHNEEKNIGKLLDKILATDFGIENLEVCIVDDFSNDKTHEILERYKKNKVIHTERNASQMGKSQTVKRGLLMSKGDLVVIQDADSEYDPEDLKAFVKAFQETDVDVIYGNRFGYSNKIIYPANWIGNTFLSFFSSIFTGLQSGMFTRDMEVCYKMAKGDLFRSIAKTISSVSSFGIEPEITAKFSKHLAKQKRKAFMQLPIHYYPRSTAEGKHMKAVSDGFKALKEIIKYNVFDTF